MYGMADAVADVAWFLLGMVTLALLIAFLLPNPGPAAGVTGNRSRPARPEA